MKKLPPLLLALLLSACAAHPLGIPDDEWEKLTPEQQRKAEDQEAKLEVLSAQQARLDLAERDRFHVIESDARKARVERRRKRMRLGDSLDCAFREGVARFDTLGWHPLEETGFRIIRGDRQGLLLPAQHAEANRPLSLDYSDTGLSIRLCGDRTQPTTCTTVAAPWHDMKDGMTWQVSAPQTLAATLRCAFTPGPPVSVMDLD